jgi:hypothetical protein
VEAAYEDAEDLMYENVGSAPSYASIVQGHWEEAVRQKFDQEWTGKAPSVAMSQAWTVQQIDSSLKTRTQRSKEVKELQEAKRTRLQREASAREKLLER